MHPGILVPQKWTEKQVKRAETKAVEFRKNSYTSGSANLDDMIALGKAVILCDSHKRKFEWKKAKYLPHPDKNLRRVIGDCDVCRLRGLSFLFINQGDAEAELRKYERYKRGLEYATLFSG